MIEKQFTNPKYMFVPNHLIYYLVGLKLIKDEESVTKYELNQSAYDPK
jgi:hypothetical protein